MHTFQPMTADMMEFDPFTKLEKNGRCSPQVPKTKQTP